MLLWTFDLHTDWRNCCAPVSHGIPHYLSVFRTPAANSRGQTLLHCQQIIQKYFIFTIHVSQNSMYFIWHFFKLHLHNATVTPKRFGQRVASVHEILRNASNTSTTCSSYALNTSNTLRNARGKKYFCACIKIFYLMNVRELILTSASNT